MTLSEHAREYAIRCHAQANQEYDNYPYEAHLFFVAKLVEIFAKDLPERRRQIAISGAWCHDVIEDARQSYNDVKKAVCVDVAEIARVLTVDPRGRSRHEKHTPAYYSEMLMVSDAALIKVCDRIANTAWSKHRGSDMFEKYRKEHPEFNEALVSCTAALEALELLYDETYSNEISTVCKDIITHIEKRYSSGTRANRILMLIEEAKRFDNVGSIHLRLDNIKTIVKEMSNE